MSRTKQGVLGSLVALGVLVATHAGLLAGAETIAYKLAPPVPPPLTETQLLTAMRERTSTLDGLTDEEALRKIRTGEMPAHEASRRERLNRDHFAYLVLTVRESPVNEHRHEVVEPLMERLKRTTNRVYAFFYVVIGLMLVGTVVRQAWILALSFVSEPSGKVSLRDHAAGWRLRRKEKEFFRLKTLYENGLLTEEEFRRKKAEFRSDIENSGLAERR